MSTLEDVFVQEFRQAVSSVGFKDIYKIPLPDCCKTWDVSGTELFLVKDIPESETYFSSLNSTIVKKLPTNFVAKRRVVDKTTRGYKVDKEGKFIYEDYTVPQGSIVVLSPVRIGLRYKGYTSATKSGFGYIDFIEKGNNNIEYMYVIPNTCLYQINQLALAMSVTNMKNYFGRGYVTWRSGTIFLHIIPYKPNTKYVGSRILATKYSLDFKQEIQTLLTFWQEVGVIPNLQLCTLFDGTNLALKSTNTGYDGYVPVDNIAIGDKVVYGEDIQQKD